MTCEIAEVTPTQLTWGSTPEGWLVRDHKSGTLYVRDTAGPSATGWQWSPSACWVKAMLPEDAPVDVTKYWPEPAESSLGCLGLSIVAGGDECAFVARRQKASDTAVSTTGVKHDAGKPRPELLAPEAMLEISKVMSYGAIKYEDNNWRKGFRWTRIAGSLLRHVLAWLGGEDNDPETGLSHIAHAGCNVMFLLTFILTGAGEDDRWSR